MLTSTDQPGKEVHRYILPFDLNKTMLQSAGGCDVATAQEYSTGLFSLFSSWEGAEYTKENICSQKYGEGPVISHTCGEAGAEINPLTLSP